MDISFDGQYDQKAFFRALRLVQRTSQWNRALRIAALGAALALAVTFVFIWATEGIPESFRLLVAALLTIFAFNPLLSAWWMTKRLFRERPLRTIKGRVNKSGLTLFSKVAQGQQRPLPWREFRRAGYADDLIGLLAKDGTLWVLRRDFFDSENKWKQFERLVKKSISETK